MGANYYMTKGEWLPESDENHNLHSLLQEGSGTPARIHIGESSGGWCFALLVMPDYGIRNLSDWKVFATRLIQDGWRIEDECKVQYTFDEMMDVIQRVGWEEKMGVPLNRHEVDDIHCIGNGVGLYDYMVGWFS